MTYIRPIDTPTNPQWAYVEEPLDLIPRTSDPTGSGQRMVDLCSLPTLTQGQYAGQPFGDTMLPWQRELIRYIWGNTDANGDRITRTLFCKIGKGAGKSTFAAMLALCHVMDLAMRGEGYRGLVLLLSPTISTADSVMGHIVEAIKFDPELAGQFKSNVARRQITHVKSGIVLEIAPPRMDAVVGRRPICLLADEIHLMAAENRQFTQILDQIRKGGTNAGNLYLEILISTAPTDVAAGAYSELLTTARKQRDEGLGDGGRFCPILFEWPHDRDDLDLQDPNEWWRGNPSAVPDGTMALDTLIEEYDTAKRTGVPRNLALFLSQRLGIEPNQSRVGTRTPLQEAWADLLAPADPAHPPSVVAIDPGGSDDPGAVCYAWRTADDGVGMRCQQYLTRQGLDRAGDALRAVYDRAIAAGELLIYDSGGALDDAMTQHILKFQEGLGSSLIVGGDSYGRAGFVPNLSKHLWNDFASVSQGWQLLRAYAALDQLAADKRLYPVKMPLLTANIENLILEDGPRGRRFAKRDAAASGQGQLKIDGAMAMVSATELLLEHAKAPFDIGALIG